MKRRKRESERRRGGEGKRKKGERKRRGEGGEKKGDTKKTGRGRMRGDVKEVGEMKREKRRR